MAVYTVTAARHRKAVEGQHGPMQVIDLTLSDGSEFPLEAEWFTKATTNVPVPGTTLDGDITDSPYGKKFKRAPSMGAGGGFGPRPEDPARARRILRQHSQDMALRTIELAVKHTIIDPPADAKDLFGLIAKTAEWFDKDANAKGDQA